MPDPKEEDVVEVELEEEEKTPEVAEATEEQEEAPEQAADSASDEDLEEYSGKVKKRIDKLTAKMREAERREKAATEYAQAVQKQMNDMETRSRQIDESYLTEYDGRVNNEEQNIKSRLATAINTGDVDAQLEAQKELARIAIESERLKMAKAEHEKRAQASETPQQEPQQQQQQRPPDPKAQAWASRNDWFGADEPMTLTAFSIHKNLVEQEYFDPKSDEYYEELDKRMREQFPHKFKDEENTKQAPARSPVASASRGSGKSGKKSVKLSPSQVAIADKLGVSYEQYAKQLARLNS